MTTIRTIFSPRRQIDRTIEKVIDYYAQEEERLAREVDEYEVTDNIEKCFRQFLDAFSEGVRTGESKEIGIWVSGFYGSGKSSFTKYLGAALDPSKTVHGKPFLDLLCERFPRNEIPARLKTIAKKHPTLVIMLDLGTEQLSESAAAPVSQVLYWKVLQWAGISKEKKIARMEMLLYKKGLYEKFKKAYKKQYNAEWESIHNDPLIGVNRAAEIIPILLPEEFQTPEKFRTLRFEEATNMRDISQEMIDLCYIKAKKIDPKIENIIFLVDEAGQYVASRGELILNLDGLARNFKELGKGKVWIIATGQQTLTEIIEKAAHNTQELNKLKDRFPIPITLDATDIREITHRRLLEKSEDGRATLLALFEQHGQSFIAHTRLTGTSLFKNDPDAEKFVKFYPFLPQHFDLLLELIKTLARSTGGIGLRSAIRVIQDVLVDKSRILDPGSIKLADREVSTLASIDDFYDTLRVDIGKVLPHVVTSVDRTSQIFSDRPLVIRVAKAVAALQPVETFPRTAENIAALLYRDIISPSLLDDVKLALRDLVNEKECGLIEDPQSGGFIFLSDAVKPLRDKRSQYIPSSGDLARIKTQILKQGATNIPLFTNQPSARLEEVKEIKAAVKLNRNPVVGEKEDIEIKLEFVEPSQFDTKREEFLLSTNSLIELQNSIILLAKNEDIIDELISEIVKSEEVTKKIDERGADKDVAQFLRAERRLGDRNKERAADALNQALIEGILIFRGRPIPVREAGTTLESAVRKVLAQSARDIFHQFHLAPIRPATDAAAKFLKVERLDRITSEYDPLRLVIKDRGSPRIDTNTPVLAEVLRTFQNKVAESGTGRLDGRFLQDLFSGPPYGWTKDTVRYLFAALLRAGEVEFHVPGANAQIRTPGPHAEEAVKSTVSFNRIGISPRNVKLLPETLDRSARRLETLFAIQVLPLEDHISNAVRQNVPNLLEMLGPLPDRLRLLGLSGEERARHVIQSATDLLRGDAGDSASLLGGTTCDLPDEIEWAKSVVTSLESGAEADVQQARDVLNSLTEFTSMFPECAKGLVLETDREVAEGLMRSDRFFDNLPQLRSIIREIKDKTKTRINDEKLKFEMSQKDALSRLESTPDWPKLSEEDREEISARLRNEPPDIDEGNPIRSLQKLTIQQIRIPTILSELRQEIEKRVPKKGIAGEPSGEEEIDEEIISLDAISEPQVITTQKELDAWLKLLRERLAVILKSNKKIRFKGPE